MPFQVYYNGRAGGFGLSLPQVLGAIAPHVLGVGGSRGSQYRYPIIPTQSHPIVGPAEVPVGRVDTRSGSRESAEPDLPPVLPGPLAEIIAAVLAPAPESPPFVGLPGAAEAVAGGPGILDTPEPAPAYETPVLAAPIFLPLEDDELEPGPGFEPGGPFDPAQREPTDWDDVVFDPRPLPEQDEDEDMAIDWGSVVSGAIDIAQGQTLGGGSSFAGPGGLSPVAPLPAQVTVDTRTGKVTKCKRRRRRRLLTPTDLSDLAALQAIVGKGDALKLAVAKAVRR